MMKNAILKQLAALLDAGKKKNEVVHYPDEWISEVPYDLRKEVAEHNETILGTGYRDSFQGDTYYHGTGSDIDAFRAKKLDIKNSSHFYDFGVHGSKTPENANTYAQYSGFRPYRGMSSEMVKGNPTVYPILMRAEKPLDMTNGLPAEIKNDLIEFGLESGLSNRSKFIKLADVDPDGLVAEIQRRAGRQKTQKFFTDKGYDAINYNWSGSANRVEFDPKNIRSVNAAFDPAKKDSADLLAGIGGATVLGGAALNSDEAQAAKEIQKHLNRPQTLGLLQALTPASGEHRGPRSQTVIDAADKIRGAGGNLGWFDGTADALEKTGWGQELSMLDYVMPPLEAAPLVLLGAGSAPGTGGALAAGESGLLTGTILGELINSLRGK